MRPRMLLALAAVLLIGANSDEVRKEFEQMNGSWQAVSVEREGKALPPADVRKIRLTIDGENYTFETGKQTIEGTHKLDPSKDPKLIDAVRTKGPDEGKTIHGIYELEGDRLHICFSAPEQARPSQFSTGEGGGLRLLEFKRIGGRR